MTLDEATLEAECSNEDECTWTAFARPEIAIDTTFTLKATVFYEAIPAGFSAFDDAQT